MTMNDDDIKIDCCKGFEPYCMNDDPDFCDEREALRQRGIDAVAMRVIPVLYNYGVGCDYRYLNDNRRKR